MGFALVVVVALIAACRGSEQRARPESRDNAGSAAISSSSSEVPQLPVSEDGTAAMRQLDRDIERAAGDEVKLASLLLSRASIRGWLEDYTRALSVSQTAIENQPTSLEALAVRGRVQLAVHAFADARATIAKLTELGASAAVDELQVGLDQATGNLDAALAARRARVDMFPDALSVTLYAATLAEADRAKEALAWIPKAAEKLRSNTPQYLAWLLFQWGLLHEHDGSLATAREFYAEAYRRLPAHVETQTHYATALVETGKREDAKAIVAGEQQHPELIALAAVLAGHSMDEATAAWERYVTALPAAFADHAARFYLGSGNNSRRALELAAENLARRDTPASRALFVQAALAEGDDRRACAEVGSLLTRGTRRQRFIAWRALTACGRTQDAERLASELGIRPH